MNHWNYRVVQTYYDDAPFWGIYEVYYKDGVPIARTEEPIRFGEFDNLADLRTDLEYAFRALDEPILNDDTFKKESDGVS